MKLTAMSCYSVASVPGIFANNYVTEITVTNSGRLVTAPQQSIQSMTTVCMVHRPVFPASQRKKSTDCFMSTVYLDVYANDLRQHLTDM